MRFATFASRRTSWQRRRRHGRLLVATAVIMTASIVLLACLANVGFRSDNISPGARSSQSADALRDTPSSATQNPPSAPRLNHDETQFIAASAYATAAHRNALFVPAGSDVGVRHWSAPVEPTPAWFNAEPVVTQLQQLRREHPQLTWPIYVRYAIDCMKTSDSSMEADALEELIYLSQPELLQANVTLPPPAQQKLTALCGSVHRRAIVWQQLQRLAARGQPQHSPGINTYAMWLQLQDAVDAIPYPQSQAWSEYLRMDELEAMLRNEPATRNELANLAIEVLDRLYSPRLNPRQRQLLACAEVDQLASMLRQCVTRPVDIAAVVNAVEDFERSGSQTDAARLASIVRQTRWSQDPLAVELARSIEEQYRAANLRISVSRVLLNLLLSEPVTTTEPVQRQAGIARVVGQRKSRAELSVDLLPANNGWHVQLLADGVITADTTVLAPQATFFVAGKGSFQISKLLLLDRHQVQASPAEATTDFDLSLNGYQTTLDGVPLIRRVARDTALAEFQQQLAASRPQVQAEVQNQARQSLDEWTEKYLAVAGEHVQAKTIVPLYQLGVPLMPAHLATTEDDLLGEFRLAGVDNLGATSPAPTLSADSFLSLHLHESALNNVLARLRMHGRRETLDRLCHELCDRFRVEAPQDLGKTAQSITLQFAAQRPLRAAFSGGGTTLTMRLDELQIADKSWTDLTVRARYEIAVMSNKPALATLVRVDVNGEALNQLDRMILNNVMRKIFARAEAIPAPASLLAAHPGGSDLTVTQCLADNGWLALAIGPGR